MISTQVFGFLITFFFKYVVSLQPVFSRSLNTHDSIHLSSIQINTLNNANTSSLAMNTSVSDFEQPSVLSTQPISQHLWGLSHAKKLMACHISSVALHHLQWSSVLAGHPYFKQLRVKYIRHLISIVILVCFVPTFWRTVLCQHESLAGFHSFFWKNHTWILSRWNDTHTSSILATLKIAGTFQSPKNCQFNSKPFMIGTLKNIYLIPFFTYQSNPSFVGYLL